jgi:methanogenic corrinoid protein MtbC1
MSVMLEEYTDAALRGDRSSAIALAADFAGRDRSCLRVVDQLLAPSQREVGRRWMHELCTVGDEHAATFVTDSVLSWLAVGIEARPSRGTLVMVCAENEWHALPARMATELLIAGGWRVVHLGPATPAGHLRSFLDEVEADVVGVSATTTANLTGAARSVRTARRLGYPVLCGGAAFDVAGRRARAIGAHGQPTDLGALRVLDDVTWGETSGPDFDGDWARLDVERVRVVRDAVSWLGAGDFADHVRSAAWLEKVTAELDGIVGVTASALLCEDPGIVAEHRTWLRARLTALGTPVEAADRSCAAIAAVVDHVVPGASALFD